ncbi:MAG: tRNA threonylcarbamoyladenosine biosynthesis protein TsaB [candidate division WS2 bacterium]|uniref:tRNA threonylcarbamoyladenosine biosynthesis protein TsaB n=1 Tax=Psychracetigena formicireducens TaxID=2986056 RepID=A0A9E2BGU9_PSYF1|nr:tRNA threonylcarbamoyladenosine biosynthesis protein TsaB [Candidatus Psychracetigena formicireducens]MBT9145277.1 tRNA threonylcarbamoyladenosine biosynthesis protein TsaB [Candidatus Psychracetigena formicireducens]MBT9150314.1 tRNA threonylcarbamoyladenosine biosynthesis protein TsaB [Candidatus Psychracetigena formicireducens]
MARSSKDTPAYLGVDSSIKGLKMALFGEEGGLIASISDYKNTASRSVSLYFSALMKACQMEVKDLKGIIVIKGPGSFTGLKVGVSFVKGLALASGLKVAGISTLKALVLSATYLMDNQARNIISLLPIIRNEIVGARYSYENGKWIEGAISTNIQMLKSKDFKVIGGNIKEELKEYMENYIIFSEGALPESWGSEGVRLLQEGEFEDIVSLDPWYGKEPEIRKPPTF